MRKSAMSNVQVRSHYGLATVDKRRAILNAGYVIIHYIIPLSKMIVHYCN